MKNFLKKYKKVIIKITSTIIKIVPVITIFLLNHDIFVDRSEKTINVFVILILIFTGLVFKDNLKKFATRPTGFKTGIVLTLLSYIMVTFGEPILQLSLWFLGSTLVALPLDIWVNAIDKPKDSNEIVKAIESLKEVMLGGVEDGE